MKNNIINMASTATFAGPSQVEKSDSCQHLQTAQYRGTCKKGAMPVLDSWYRAEGWLGTGIV